MRNIRLVIEYDGTTYNGWQSQNNAKAIQDIVKQAIYKLTNEDVRLTGSSRTDAGVHALGQSANFITGSGIPAGKFAYALNTILPDDISIRKSEEVPPEFHSRFCAKGKKYRYLVCNSCFPSAILRNRAFFVPNKLNVEAMQQAAGFFLGTHEFDAFMAAGGSTKTTERTITGISVARESDSSFISPSVKCKRVQDEHAALESVSQCYEPGIIRLDISGDGFLYNMVRIIAGTLVYVGLGKIDPVSIPEIIASKSRHPDNTPPHLPTGNFFRHYIHLY